MLSYLGRGFGQAWKTGAVEPIGFEATLKQFGVGVTEAIAPSVLVLNRFNWPLR